MKSLQFFATLFGLAALAKSQCNPGEFECEIGPCIPEHWFCDGKQDCNDKSDEPEGCPPCPVSQFLCANGNCVPGTFICDNDDDCKDMSDELDPVTGQCPACIDYYYQCKTGRCISKFDVCNGYDNCGDGSDEFENPADCPPCEDDQFQCPNSGKCIYGTWVCDGDNDCNDWSDETEEACPCSNNELRCPPVPNQHMRKPGACIPAEFFCDPDQIWDCPNGFDESNCTNIATESSKSNKL